MPEANKEQRRIVATEKRTVLVVHNVPDGYRLTTRRDPSNGTLKITIDK